MDHGTVDQRLRGERGRALTNAGERLRAIVDTNLLVGALARPDGSAARILEHWRAGDFEHVASAATLREAELVVGARWVARIADAGARDALLAELRERSVLVEAPVLDELTLKDAGDRRLVEAAHAGGARYLVTADREVLLMRGYASVEIVTAGEFLRALSAAAG